MAVHFASLRIFLLNFLFFPSLLLCTVNYRVMPQSTIKVAIVMGTTEKVLMVRTSGGCMLTSRTHTHARAQLRLVPDLQETVP